MVEGEAVQAHLRAEQAYDAAFSSNATSATIDSLDASAGAARDRLAEVRRRVAAARPAPTLQASTSSSVDGHFRFDSVPPGEYTLATRAALYGSEYILTKQLTVGTEPARADLTNASVLRVGGGPEDDVQSGRTICAEYRSRGP